MKPFKRYQLNIEIINNPHRIDLSGEPTDSVVLTSPVIQDHVDVVEADILKDFSNIQLQDIEIIPPELRL